jgi:hypothetical protein
VITGASDIMITLLALYLLLSNATHSVLDVKDIVQELRNSDVQTRDDQV